MNTSKQLVLHITPEIFEYAVGGVATVINEIYKHTDSNTEFLFVTKLKFDDIKDLGKRVKTETYEYFLSEECDFSKYDKIFFHSHIFLHFYMTNHKLTGKEYFVMHSNPIIENCYLGIYGETDRSLMYWEFITNPLLKFVVVSQKEKTTMIKTSKMIENAPEDLKDRIFVIHNGLDFNKVKKPKITKTQTFGYLGRLDNRKGLVELADIFKNRLYTSNLLLSTGGEARYMMGAYYRLTSIIKDSPNIKMLGYCTGKRKQSFFNNIDALIVPSLYEPFGLVILEAFKEGKIVITTKTDGITEILGDDYPFYFDILNTNDFIKVIDKFNNAPKNTLEYIIKETQQKLSKRFNTQLMVNKYNEI